MAEKQATTRWTSIITVLLALGVLWVATPGSAQETYEPWVTDFGGADPAPAYTPWVTDFGGARDPVTEPGAIPVAPNPLSAPATGFDWADALIGALGATLVLSLGMMATMAARTRRRLAT